MVIKHDDESAFEHFIKVMQRGGVAILPCDTIYGMVALPLAAPKIIRIKGRDTGKPFLRLIPAADAVKTFYSKPVDRQLLRYWPGPLTLVVAVDQGGELGRTPSLAVRVPADDFLRKAMDALKQPLLSTSVNRSGEPVLWEIQAITAQFEQEVDLIIDGGDFPRGQPSTILDIRQHPYTILRQGALRIPRRFLK